jgi:hypothetical protein
MQENLNPNRKNFDSKQPKESAVKSENMSIGASSLPGKLKDQSPKYSKSQRDDAVDVLTYMSFKL